MPVRVGSVETPKTPQAHQVPSGTGAAALATYRADSPPLPSVAAPAHGPALLEAVERRAHIGTRRPPVKRRGERRLCASRYARYRFSILSIDNKRDSLYRLSISTILEIDNDALSRHRLVLAAHHADFRSVLAGALVGRLRLGSHKEGITFAWMPGLQNARRPISCLVGVENHSDAERPQRRRTGLRCCAAPLWTSRYGNAASNPVADPRA